MTMRETLEAQQLLWAQKIPKGFEKFFPKGGSGSTGDSTSKRGEKVRGFPSTDRQSPPPRGWGLPATQHCARSREEESSQA